LIATIFCLTLLLSSNANAQKFLILTKAQWMWLPTLQTTKKCGQTSKSDLQASLKDVVKTNLLQREKVWRTGANEAEIHALQDMKLGGTKIKAGTYTLYAIPEKDIHYNY
jgi:hypothetical protein